MRVGLVLYYLLVAIVVVLAAVAVYLLVRILLVYARARRLQIMRNYETMLYAVLPRITAEEALHVLLRERDDDALEEVLLRMRDQAETPWKDKVVELYRLAGYAEKRLRQLSSPSRSRRCQAARRLGRMGIPEAMPRLRELLEDPHEAVRDAARRALLGTEDRDGEGSSARVGAEEGPAEG